MKGALGKKVGPLPLGAWLLIAGGSLGLLILIEKSKTKTASATGTTETEAEALKKKELEEEVQGIESGLPAQGGTTGSGGGGSAGNTPEANTPVTPATPPPAAEATPAQSAANPVETPKENTPAPAPVTVKSAAKQFGPRNMNIETVSPLTGKGTGKVGAEYTVAKYKGMAAHAYDTAVKGGVGPGKNIIVLNGSKKTHAAQGKHEPAHAKDKTVAQHHVTTRKPRAASAFGTFATQAKRKAAPKKKIKARAPAKHAAQTKRKVRR
jgi:hypothetical protein